MLAALVTALTACASGAHDASAPPVDPSFSVIPAALEIAPGDTAQFTATADGAPVVNATWHLGEADAGAVTDAGLYTAAAVPGTYHVIAASADASKTSTATVTVKANPSTQIRQGTGASYGGSFVTGVTGGGAMPSWTGNVVTAACAGDGSTDDTGCLQAAANAARDQGKVLVVPATGSYYRVTGPVIVSTSIGGVGGTPTIRTTNSAGTNAGSILRLAPGMTGWVYNLHLVGAFDGGNASGEWAHNIDVGSVSGVTISGNVLENAIGDAVGTDASAFDGGSTRSVNVLVDANTMRNPYRCAVAFTKNQSNWLITNNLIDKQVNYVSGIDIEPEAATVTNVEIAYNRFVMNNRTPNPNRGADGKAVFAWQTPTSSNPGGNYYLHHNYGTFGTGFVGIAGAFGYVYQASNVEGGSVPQ